MYTYIYIHIHIYIYFFIYIQRNTSTLHSVSAPKASSNLTEGAVVTLSVRNFDEIDNVQVGDLSISEGGFAWFTAWKMVGLSMKHG